MVQQHQAGPFPPCYAEITVQWLGLFFFGDGEYCTAVKFFCDDGLELNAKKCVNNPCKFSGTCVQRLLEPVKTMKLHLAVDWLE
jgi:hypothetical protein